MISTINKKEKKQNCGTCRYASKCYSPSASPRNVTLNILACRIKLGINSNESSKLLLSMIRPILIKLINNARSIVGNHYIDFDVLICDLESRVIECLLDNEDGYKLGESAYLTEYLFGTNPRTGWVKKWILWQSSKQQRFLNRHILIGNDLQADGEEELTRSNRSLASKIDLAIVEDPLDKSDTTIKQLLDIVNDGITLNANEYRVMSFCLSHTNELNKSRLIDGTHTYLSSIMHVSRPRVTRLMAVATKKLRNSAAKRGVEF